MLKFIFCWTNISWVIYHQSKGVYRSYIKQFVVVNRCQGKEVVIILQYVHIFLSEAYGYKTI